MDLSNIVLFICLGLVSIFYCFMWLTSKKAMSQQVNLENYEKVVVGKGMFYASIAMIILAILLIIVGILSNYLTNVIFGILLGIAFIFQTLNAKVNMYIYVGKTDFYYMGQFIRYKSIRQALCPKGFFSKKYKCTTFNGEQFNLPVAVIEEIKPYLGKNVIKAL